MQKPLPVAAIQLPQPRSRSCGTFEHAPLASGARHPLPPCALHRTRRSARLRPPLPGALPSASSPSPPSPRTSPSSPAAPSPHSTASAPSFCCVRPGLTLAESVRTVAADTASRSSIAYTQVLFQPLPPHRSLVSARARPTPVSHAHRGRRRPAHRRPRPPCPRTHRARRGLRHFHAPLPVARSCPRVAHPHRSSLGCCRLGLPPRPPRHPPPRAAYPRPATLPRPRSRAHRRPRSQEWTPRLPHSRRRSSAPTSRKTSTTLLDEPDCLRAITRFRQLASRRWRAPTRCPNLRLL